MMYLPKSMTMPDNASTTKQMAVVQWAVRSIALKRSMRRPVGWPCSLIGPAAPSIARRRCRAARVPRRRRSPRDGARIDATWGSPPSLLRVLGSQVFVLVAGALREGLLVFRLVALEEIPGVRLGVLLARVG